MTMNWQTTAFHEAAVPLSYHANWKLSLELGPWNVPVLS